MSNDWHSKAVEVFGYQIGGYLNHNAIAKLFERIDGALLADSQVVLSITLNAEEEKDAPQTAG